jgi:hypothetical protein
MQPTRPWTTLLIGHQKDTAPDATLRKMLRSAQSAAYTAIGIIAPVKAVAEGELRHLAPIANFHADMLCP